MSGERLQDHWSSGLSLECTAKTLIIAQADLSLCWVHRSFCWFCHVEVHIYNNNINISIRHLDEPLNLFSQEMKKQNKKTTKQQ